jgi:hypothetical protein
VAWNYKHAGKFLKTPPIVEVPGALGQQKKQEHFPDDNQTACPFFISFFQVVLVLHLTDHQ